MPNSGTESHREVETLTRSVEGVLRRLIRFLVGRISLVRLQEMVRFIYVEEAEDQLKCQNPTKSVPLTKLAVLTGLDTRTLTRTRNHENYGKPFHQNASFLREFLPGAIILDVWSSSSKYLDPDTNLPKKLSLTGSTDSFEELFSASIKSRGVTPQSLLDRLLENQSVKLRDNGTNVELVNRAFFPNYSSDQLGTLVVGYTAIAQLLDTVVHNFNSESNEEKFYQRSFWTDRLATSNRNRLKGELTELLRTTEFRGRETLGKFEEDYQQPSQMTAGISLSYFEFDPE